MRKLYDYVWAGKLAGPSCVEAAKEVGSGLGFGVTGKGQRGLTLAARFVLEGIGACKAPENRCIFFSTRKDRRHGGNLNYIQRSNCW